jgi:hypothetical protein
MSSIDGLLDDLAAIGATILPSGERLILRAGHSAIPATLVQRVRVAKRDLIRVLASAGGQVTGDSHQRIVDWLNQHPAPSPEGRCAWCGEMESPSAIVLPFGTQPGTHTWLHAECWPAWHQARRGEALRRLTVPR